MNPFACGLPVPVVLRLLRGEHTRGDRAAYYRTEWWSAQKARALASGGQKCRRCQKAVGTLHVHHLKSGYKRMFNEDLEKDLEVLCRNCHRREHHK